MWRMRRGASRPAWTAFAVAVLAVSVLLLAAYDAEARTKKRNPGHWYPGFSAIVVDAKTGQVLDSAKPDEPRHPASLTKIMTLYLLFAEIEAGRLKLNSKIKISGEAASQSPSKLGLNPGETIEVEHAIKAMITRSANDIAVAVAEVISGDEDSFAKQMTRRARQLGMKHTVFKNASGLPHPEQITTARELALLGLALQDRFPSLYRYFATRTFHWRGAAIGNHNRLLGSVAGVDGIKTGYTQASGFNLVTNVKRGPRHMVAVVLGGRTAAARDELMRELIDENIMQASTGPRTAPRFAEMPPATTPRPPPPEAGSLDPIRPMPVRTVPLGKGGAPMSAGDKPAAPAVLTVSTLSNTSLQQPLQIAPYPAVPAAPAAPALKATPHALLPPATVPAASAKTAPAAEIAAAPQAVASTDERTSASAKGGWLIQIGAYLKEEEARLRLVNAKESARNLLSRVSSYTEKTVKGATQYFRARFAGFDEAGAKRACETLKKSDFACIAIRN